MYFYMMMEHYAFSNKNEKIEGKTLVKEYGNIAGQEYKTSSYRWSRDQ